MPADLLDEMLRTVTFEDHDGKTKLTITQGPIPEGKMRELTDSGWSSSLDKLAESLK